MRRLSRRHAPNGRCAAVATPHFCILQPNIGRRAGRWRCWAAAGSFELSSVLPQACSPSSSDQIHVHLPHFVHLLTWCFSFFFCMVLISVFPDRFLVLALHWREEHGYDILFVDFWIFTFLKKVKWDEGDTFVTFLKKCTQCCSTWFWRMLVVTYLHGKAACIFVGRKNTGNWSDFREQCQHYKS